MYVLYGSRALPEFRVSRLARRLGECDLHFNRMDSHYVYLFPDAAPRSAQTKARLSQLLEASEQAVSADLYVVPRFGTITPWSSKAGDILSHCGLKRHSRVERGIAWAIEGQIPEPGSERWHTLEKILSDRMTQVLVPNLTEAARLFHALTPQPDQPVTLLEEGDAALRAIDQQLGLSLGVPERAYLLEHFGRLQRNPTRAELMMFAQVNSEHCRHKVFRGQWILDGQGGQPTPFEHIQASYRAHPEGILSAYKDNAAVIEDTVIQQLGVDSSSKEYVTVPGESGLVIKVETHNHPTGVSPFAGAATGSGGEIRDEAATGRGGRPKAGLVGYMVSDLHLPEAPRPWETEVEATPTLASPLQIMLEAPIGAASFNNEFGRPAICGFFRSFCQADEQESNRYWGYHKPLMLAGGLGSIPHELVNKRRFGAGTRIGVLGGPAFEIGLGGGAASSRHGGMDSELDFASVQRGNPEMERRAQEVIDAAAQLGVDNPILALHDVGAGGLSNAIPELLAEAGLGGWIDLALVPNAEPGMSSMALWCNEAQERYVLAVEAGEGERRLAQFAMRERCPWAVIGQASDDGMLRVRDGRLKETVVDLPMKTLLGDLPALKVQACSRPVPQAAPEPVEVASIDECLDRVLSLPGVGDKEFLITIGDRTVSGLVARDPLVGPWQVAVADVGVTLADYEGVSGEAMAIGERTPIAVYDAVASARMAIGETVTNLAASDIERLSDVRLSANWMAAAGNDMNNGDLYRAVRSVGSELAPELGLAIPVGKDSLSMRVSWGRGDQKREVQAPLSLIVSGFAPVSDVRRTLTPELHTEGESELWLIDLGRGANRLGGSAWAQVFGRRLDPVPNVDYPEDLKGFFAAFRQLAREGCVLAYHDRSDGGLAVTAIEMALASHCGVKINVETLDITPIGALFNEELGAVFQCPLGAHDQVIQTFSKVGLSEYLHQIGEPCRDNQIQFVSGSQLLYESSWMELRRRWSEVSWRLQALRDDPECAREAYEIQCDESHPGLKTCQLTFNPEARQSAGLMLSRPRVALLREQGVNGHRELAMAFKKAGFQCIDVHMSELMARTGGLEGFAGLAVPGGFSYGDALGAGLGWAKSILYHSRLRDEFERFFASPDRFAVGICNGCQMLSGLRELIPGSEGWPRFMRNRSEQFEARLALVEVLPSVSPFFRGMEGSVIPVSVSHGEGRAEFSQQHDLQQLMKHGQIPLRYAEKSGHPALRYPLNPNGSPSGVTGFVNEDGRILILMPHPERSFRTDQYSWHPADWGDTSPWMRLFQNVRAWVK